jgi:hypothetical protein
MIERGIKGTGNLKKALFIMTFLTVVFPTVAWANISFPPGMRYIPPTLIILLPLVMLFTELGGGYRIMEAETPGKHNILNRWKPLLAIAAIITPAFFPIEWPPTLVIVGGVIVFSIIRGLNLINYGLYKKDSENQPAWRKHARPKRLIPAGLAIVFVTVILTTAILAAATSPNRYRGRAYDSDTKANLHNIYLACKAYWADSGSSSNCDLDIAALTTYGYIQSSRVVVAGNGGHEKKFNITAMHQESKKAFEVDELGGISQLDGEYESKSGKTIDFRTSNKKPEEPSIFSKAWGALVDIYR